MRGERMKGKEEETDRKKKEKKKKCNLQNVVQIGVKSMTSDRIVMMRSNQIWE